jgi:uncharacterized protein
MKNPSREFQVFAKPVGSKCNLSCRYCYYLVKNGLYSDSDGYLMNDETLEKYIIQHIEATSETTIFFSWHGGEPLLAGIGFFKKVLKYQEKHKPYGGLIINGIQTNGTLLNETWCRFLSDKKFVVGISIDGPGDLHNIYRRTGGNDDSFIDVIRGYKLLKKYGLLCEILCVVNADNVKQPLVVYNFFKQLGAEYMTFLPLVEHLPESPAGVSKNSVPSEAFGIFLSSIFDEWVSKDIGRIKIQIFEEAARTAFNQEHSLCIFKISCGGVPVVEHNGDFYSCDHYVDSDHFLGSINDHPLSYFLDCETQKKFGMAKSETLPKYCIDCDVKSMCNGECPKNRFISTPGGEPGLNYLCSGYKYFFTHCLPFIEAISAEWKNQTGS